MGKENLSKPGEKVKNPARRLSRKEKIKVLTAIQEFGIGTYACPETSVQDLDQLYHLANKWKAELEKPIFRQEEDNVVFILFT
ncbi:MAG: hypothetical protein AB1847_19920 [bacterium]